ncbi:MAG: hypothetical protein DVB32_04860 [Verrucomicrobia bacterium]|nr:MAG: hypothetical protein DVB32_04860 [Verrucomicrobiota bacterium]
MLRSSNILKKTDAQLFQEWLSHANNSSPPQENPEITSFNKKQNPPLDILVSQDGKIRKVWHPCR